VLFQPVSFDERIEADDVRLSPRDCVSDFLFERTNNALASLQLSQLGKLWRGAEQPAFQFLPIDFVIVERRLDAPLELVAVIFEADQEHARTAEDVLSAEWSADCHRNKLQQSQRAFAGAAGCNDGRDKATAELVTEQPLPRRNGAWLVTCIPLAQAGGC